MMPVPPPVPLPGCRHDVLGHALKAIGILRAISTCASHVDCDPSAEGWWDPQTACFTIRSARYPDVDAITKFFAERYRPTPLIAAWNKSGGVTDNIEVSISCNAGNDKAALLQQFREQHADKLLELGLGKKKKISKAGVLKFSTDSANRDDVEKTVAEFNTSIATSEADAAPVGSGPISAAFKSKESGKKDGVLPNASRLLSDDAAFQESLRLARRYVADLQAADESAEATGTVFLRYRDRLSDRVVESFDSLCALHIAQQNDNPLFVRRGRPGDKVNADIFLNFWSYFQAFRKNTSAFANASLIGGRIVGSGIPSGDRKGKGTPFFPDAIKSYNQGTAGVTEEFPFCPLDYILAVEGALAMRGATSKTLNARSRSRAAFPFVFEGTDTMTDEQGKALRLASSFWLPIWTRPTTFSELQSFILDCQARLPSKDCRFSSDFARAIRSSGVDAGFFAFQEFRFKLKGANVPWATTGQFTTCSGTATAAVLNDLLRPVDSSGFLNQFEFSREKKIDLHPQRAPVLDAIETAAAEPGALKILDVLCRLATLNAQLAKSKTLREKVGRGNLIFIPSLPSDAWSAILREMEADPEFEIARALASIRGHEIQPDGTFSGVEPFLGSLLPLQRRQRTWFLPDPPSAQAVWTGIDLTRDLANVFARRVLDSSKDVRPAIVGACAASLGSVLAFLRGELDDRRMAAWIEGLSLIDWRYRAMLLTPGALDASDHDDDLDPLPLPYAALRSLLEVGIESGRRDKVGTADRSGPRVNLQRPIAFVCRQEPALVAAATNEALRRLAIVGVPNTYGENSRREKPYLAGRDIVQLKSSETRFQCDGQLSRRLAAAVLIPLHLRDRWKLFRAVTLPQAT
jgi:CRISPR-associated protein Csx17